MSGANVVVGLSTFMAAKEELGRVVRNVVGRRVVRRILRDGLSVAAGLIVTECCSL